jgi:hypothetical protein|tara:strand:- start:422 stop:856 length:435 start_codon:yes stop_codon:yes gene_type:complete
MGDLIKFPTHKIKPNSKPERPPLSEEEARLIKEEKFVEQITESLILDIIHVLQENAVETKTDIFLRDLAIIIESIKSLLKRDFGIEHPMHNITDAIVRIHNLDDGRKVTDINYNNVRRTKKAKKVEKSIEEELDIEFDPDINLD